MNIIQTTRITLENLMVIGNFCIRSGLIVKLTPDGKKYDSRNLVTVNILNGIFPKIESVAQLVEQLPLKKTVVGSNPTGLTGFYGSVG